MPRLRNRSDASVEFKRRNVSAVLKGMGEDWMDPATGPPSISRRGLRTRWPGGWRPTRHGCIARRARTMPGQTGMREAAQLWVGPPPTLSNRPPPQELEQMLGIARRFDAAGRDERNRALGRAGEALALAHERAVLAGAGRGDLAQAVRWVSDEEGDGAGYDIASFRPDGRCRLLEVKTTNGWERTPFHITRNELAVAEERRGEWRLFRLWNFSREPKAFELAPPLDAHVSLMPTAFQASFR